LKITIATPPSWHWAALGGTGQSLSVLKFLKGLINNILQFIAARNGKNTSDKYLINFN
jgi:hypothetical protein